MTTMSPSPPPSRPSSPTSPAMSPETLITELQSFGLRLVDPRAGAQSRRGGAGPSDHKAVLVDGRPIMAPVHTATAFASPYVALKPDGTGRSTVERDGVPVGEIAPRTRCAMWSPSR